MSSYQKIKDFVSGRLQLKYNDENVLEDRAIEEELENVKKLLSTNAKVYVFDDSDIQLSDEEFIRMHRELETHFNVHAEIGFLMQGESQQNRDNTWWTGEIQQISDNYYWNRYKKYLKKSLPDNVVRTIDLDTDLIMNNIENPNIDSFERYGMVVGHVQSGKTANYSSLICKAADAGYKFIVVIAGGINNLRNQTQERINESFVGSNKGKPVGVGKGSFITHKEPTSLTTVEMDFNQQDANRYSQIAKFETNITPMVIVIKKHTSTLSNVIDWLEKIYHKNKISNHAMLMIDDESDYASINYNDENNPTKINEKLRVLLNLFHKSTYVAYTATPYANIFIDHEATHKDYGSDLFPNDFIYALNAPDSYFGARKIFLDEDRKYLVPIDDYLEDIPPKHKKDWTLSSIPASLYEAMRVFILNIAIRSLRGQGDKHNSMLIHATRFTDVHYEFSLHVSKYIEDIKEDVDSYGKLNNSEEYSRLIKNLHETLELRYCDIEFTWKNILNTICNIIETIVIREVRQKRKDETKLIPLEYREKLPTNAIVIGGTSLARGYTLEGLSVSYFLRNTVFYDTLMQMGRWFGYRIGYEDICKIYMSETMIDNFGRIIEATEDLIKDFKVMSEANKTPDDFGLAVKQHPDSALQVTARNKQKNIREFTFNMKLEGQAKETSWLSSSKKAKENNLLSVENIIKKLEKNYNKENIGNSIVWKNIDKKIVMDFLNNFQVYQKDALGISVRMPIAFIKKYVQTRENDWDVALYSGKGEIVSIASLSFKREGRKGKEKEDNDYIEIQGRQISTGTSESIALESSLRKELGSNRKEIRKNLKNPLLRLHILDVRDKETGLVIDEKLAAFGVSFPGSALSKNETVNLKINTVYYKNLLEDLEIESDD